MDKAKQAAPEKIVSEFGKTEEDTKLGHPSYEKEYSVNKEKPGYHDKTSVSKGKESKDSDTEIELRSTDLDKERLKEARKKDSSPKRHRHPKDVEKKSDAEDKLGRATPFEDCSTGKSFGRHTHSGEYKRKDGSKRKRSHRETTESEDFDAKRFPRRGSKSKHRDKKRCMERGTSITSEEFDSKTLEINDVENFNLKNDLKSEIPRQDIKFEVFTAGKEDRENFHKRGSSRKPRSEKGEGSDTEKTKREKKSQQLEAGDPESNLKGNCMACKTPRKGDKSRSHDKESSPKNFDKKPNHGRANAKPKECDCGPVSKGHREDTKWEDSNKESSNIANSKASKIDPKRTVSKGEQIRDSIAWKDLDVGRKGKKGTPKSSKGEEFTQEILLDENCLPGKTRTKVENDDTSRQRSSLALLWDRAKRRHSKDNPKKGKLMTSLLSGHCLPKRKPKEEKERISTCTCTCTPDICIHRNVKSGKTEEAYPEVAVQTEGILAVPGRAKHEIETQPDYILVYFTNNNKQLTKTLERYSANLESANFSLESVISKKIRKATFIKVYVSSATAPVLAQRYEIRLSCTNPFHQPEAETAACWQCLDTIITRRNTKVEVYLRNRESVNGLRPKEATSAERIMIAHEVLRSTTFGNKPTEFGLEEIRSRGIVATAYPIHDGSYKWTNKGPLNDRQLLNAYWANFCVFWKTQPIQLIKKYFGPEVALYFALMGIYIAMLTPAAFVGMGVFLLRPNCTNSTRTTDICKNETVTCPNCMGPKFCNYSMIKGACNYSYLNCMFDNDGYTMPFGVFMSFWCIVLFIIWERKESMMRILWSLYSWHEKDFNVRQDYFNKANTKYKSPITGKVEPSVSSDTIMSSRIYSVIGMLVIVSINNIRWRSFAGSECLGLLLYVKCIYITKVHACGFNHFLIQTVFELPTLGIFTNLGMILAALSRNEGRKKETENLPTPLILVLLGILCIIIFCRIRIRDILTRKYPHKHASVKVTLRGDANINTAIICGFINVVFIIMLDPVVDILAYYLTAREIHRTQNKYDESYLMKLFILKFINNLNYVVYLALFRNIANVYPGNYNMWTFFYGINRDVCDISGCVTDVWIAVLIIAMIKPPVNLVKNVFIPVLLKRRSSSSKFPQWEADYDLIPLPKYYFAKLNIDLIIQYALVICFASVFQPLPLILWFYNIIELRMIAMLIVRYCQRPVPRQIGRKSIWRRMIYIVTLIGMVINALVLGLTVDYFDRLSYYSKKNTSKLGMIEGRLTGFKTALYDKSVINGKTEPIPTCMYQGLRNATDSVWFTYSIDHYRSSYRRYFFTTQLLMVQYALLFIFLVLVRPIKPSVEQMAYYQERKRYLEVSEKKSLNT